MHPFGMMHCFKELHKSFKVSKENQGEKLVITLSGSKEEISKLDKKIDAISTLTEDCCCSKGHGHDEEKQGCC